MLSRVSLSLALDPSKLDFIYISGKRESFTVNVYVAPGMHVLEDYCKWHFQHISFWFHTAQLIKLLHVQGHSEQQTYQLLLLLPSGRNNCWMLLQ